MAEPVLLRKEDEVAHLTLNRPEAFNALNLEVMDVLGRHLIGLAMDDAVRAIVITGEGRAFCAGGDLKWMLDFPGGLEPGLHALAAPFHQAVVEIRRMSKPVIAAVNGVAAGGGFSLALACDFRVMAKGARFVQAYTSNGLCIDGGGTFNLPRLVGVARALEIAAFDQPITPDQALEWGLATKVVEDAQVLEEAGAMARQLAQRSIHSLGLVKRLFNDSFSTSLETQLEHERDGIRACGGHPDGAEGMRAFTEKRKPVFNPQK
jgi:2-(1,2-epoxy-1,2-dihydrophenyl)acetyl-CoA isomerase